MPNKLVTVNPNDALFCIFCLPSKIDAQLDALIHLIPSYNCKEIGKSTLICELQCTFKN
jgi:hypothetical protein